MSISGITPHAAKVSGRRRGKGSIKTGRGRVSRCLRDGVDIDPKYVVRRIGAEWTFIDERGAVGVRLEPTQLFYGGTDSTSGSRSVQRRPRSAKRDRDGDRTCPEADVTARRDSALWQWRFSAKNSPASELWLGATSAMAEATPIGRGLLAPSQYPPVRIT